MEKQVPFCVKLYKSLLFAAALETVVGILVMSSDSVIAGLMINEEAVAALTVVNPIYLLLSFFSVLVTQGTEILFPYEVGKMDLKRANEYFSQSCITAGFLGITFFILISLFRENFYDFMNIQGQVREYADAYISTIKWAYLIMPIADTFGGMVYVDGDELISNISNIFLFFGNIGSSIIFTRFYGVEGLALGTIVGYVGNIIFPIIHFFRKSSTLHFSWHFSFRDMFKVAKFSVIDALIFVLSGILSVIIEKIIIENYGESYLPVYASFMHVLSLAFLFDCIGEANSPVVNVFRGEGNSKGIKEIFNSSIKVASSFGLIIMALVFVAAPIFPYLCGIQSPEIFDLAVKAVRIGSLSLVALSVLFVFNSYYLVIEKIGLSIIITLLKDCIPTLICILLFSKLLGFTGIWLGFALGPWIGLFLSLLFIKLKSKDLQFPYLVKNNDANIFSQSLEIENDSMIKVRDNANTFLIEHNVAPSLINKILVLIEEAFMYIKDKNPGKKIYGECSIIIEEKIKIIFRDNGVIFNMTDPDSQLSSFRSFFVACLMEHYADKANLPTTSYDRNVFQELVKFK